MTRRRGAGAPGRRGARGPTGSRGSSPRRVEGGVSAPGRERGRAPLGRAWVVAGADDATGSSGAAGAGGSESRGSGPRAGSEGRVGGPRPQPTMARPAPRRGGTGLGGPRALPRPGPVHSERALPRRGPGRGDPLASRGGAPTFLRVRPPSHHHRSRPLRRSSDKGGSVGPSPSLSSCPKPGVGRISPLPGWGKKDLLVTSLLLTSGSPHFY